MSVEVFNIVNELIYLCETLLHTWAPNPPKVQGTTVEPAEIAAVKAKAPPNQKDQRGILSMFAEIPLIALNPTLSTWECLRSETLPSMNLQRGLHLKMNKDDQSKYYTNAPTCCR